MGARRGGGVGGKGGSCTNLTYISNLELHQIYPLKTE